MKPLDEIKQMMATGAAAKAAEALKELLEKDPQNLQAKMLYGTCCQLLGDEETFKRIHDELAPVMEKQEKLAPQSETVSLWQKYHTLWMTLLIGGLVLVSLTGAAIYYGNEAKKQMEVASLALYGGPMYGVVSKETKTAITQEKELSREVEEAHRNLEEQRRIDEKQRVKSALYAAPQYATLDKEEASKRAEEAARREREKALRKTMEEVACWKAEEAAKKAAESK